jgi:predicted GIY-YIG superfamily endonuclease/ribosomal protein S14
MTTNIYILKLQQGKFYVGKSQDPMGRYAEHLAGQGSAWTRRYKPVGVEKILENASPFDEDKLVKEMMAKHGIENVRGGSYVAEELDEIQEEALLREIWGAQDRCTACGRHGHFIASCSAKTDILGNRLVAEPAPLFNPKPHPFTQVAKKNSCFRCGRTGHYASDCYAMTNVKGEYLDSDSENDWSDSNESEW